MMTIESEINDNDDQPNDNNIDGNQNNFCS